MSYRVERFHIFPEQAMQVRQRVFVEEQGFRDEFDALDAESVHFVMFDHADMPVAVCRVYESPEENTYILGRLAVIKECRGKDLGSFLVGEAESYVQTMGAKELRLHAQCRASAFYSKLGFTCFGAVEDEEGCPHIWMKKRYEE